MFISIFHNSIKEFCGNAVYERNFRSPLCDALYLGFQILMKRFSLEDAFFKRSFDFVDAHWELMCFVLIWDGCASGKEMTNEIAFIV